MKLTKLTTPNGQLVYIDADNVFSVRPARLDMGDAPKSQSVILSVGGQAQAVREDIAFVVKVLEEE